jgi:DNA-binding Lrp family transcriptional regulator
VPDTVIIEVTVDRHDDEIFKAFSDALAELPEVMEAYLLSGEYDYLIKVAVAGTEGYEKLPAPEAVQAARRAPHALDLRAALPEALALGHP